jgi:hypothetical protein
VTKINLKATKTEYEWGKALDSFWLKATPLWFDWMKWVFMIGALSYLEQTSHLAILRLAYGISYLFLFFYLQSFFNSIEFHGIPFIKTERYARIVSLTFSAIFTIIIWLFLSNLVSKIHGKV